MDIKKNILKRLNSLHNFAITQELFDEVTLFGIGPKIKELRSEKIARELRESDALLIKTLTSEYTNPTQRHIAEVLLKNQLQHISVISETSVGYRGITKSLMMGMAARVIKHIMAVDGLVGIQPMPGPVGLVYHMSYTLDSKGNDSKDDASNRSICLEVKSTAVEAVTRKLQAHWTIELAQDLRALHQLDVEKELISIMAQEIAFEIVNEILSDLVNIAEQNPNTRSIKLVGHEPSYMSDNIKHVLHAINYNANRIAEATRRGQGNTIVTSPVGVALLQTWNQVHDLHFVSATSEELRCDGPLHYVGYVGTPATEDGKEYRQFEIYSTLSPILCDSANENEVKFLIGYKGRNGECDTGYIYAPYITVLPTGLVIDPHTFQPLIAVKSRYGKWIKPVNPDQDNADEVTSKFLGEASDYYNILTVDISSSNQEKTTENPQ